LIALSRHVSYALLLSASLPGTANLRLNLVEDARKSVDTKSVRRFVQMRPDAGGVDALKWSAVDDRGRRMGLNDPGMRSVSVVPEPHESHEVALYRYLLDPRFAGMTLKLAAHEYMLGARAGQEALVSLGVGQFTRDAYTAAGLDPDVATMAEKGYIHLGDRSLLGVNVMTYDRDGIAFEVDADNGVTVLDGSDLQALLWNVRHYKRPLAVFPENRPLIRAERGNRIERLTLRWSSYSSVFQPTLAIIGPAVRVAECKFQATGPAILVYPAGAANLSISAEIVGNVIRRMDRYAIVASTFMCGNSRTNLFLSGNRIEGDVGGGFGHVLIHNANADRGEVHVTSGRNRYLGPTTGIRVRGAKAFLTEATRNTVTLNSIDDRFEGLHYGVLVWGAAGTHRADDNQVVVRLVGSRFERTAIANVGAVAREGGPGENNHVRIFVHGATDTSGMPYTAFEGPSSCGVNNRVEVLGNPEAWETNPQMLPHEP
jgi:hypothetical protein